MPTPARPVPAHVHVVATGGTFDKVYDPTREKLDLIAPSAIPRILEACGVRNVTFHPLMQIDSQTMDDTVRATLLAYVRALDGDRVVIVHGTSTMVETARFFQEAGHREVRHGDAGPIATCVFTGAMVPFAYSNVEAAFNLGGAVALASVMPAGVYVHMHGEVFDPATSAKDVEKARIVRVAI